MSRPPNERVFQHDIDSVPDKGWNQTSLQSLSMSLGSASLQRTKSNLPSNLVFSISRIKFCSSSERSCSTSEAIKLRLKPLWVCTSSPEMKSMISSDENLVKAYKVRFFKFLRVAKQGRTSLLTSPPLVQKSSRRGSPNANRIMCDSSNSSDTSLRISSRRVGKRQSASTMMSRS